MHCVLCWLCREAVDTHALDSVPPLVVVEPDGQGPIGAARWSMHEE